MLAKKLLTTTGQEEKLDASDVFSTYLYTGNGSTQTINNGIALDNSIENAVVSGKPSTLPKSVTGEYTGITYGAGKFVLVGDGSLSTTYAAYSSNGDTWTATTLPQQMVWKRVVYCSTGGFIAMGVTSSGNSSVFARSTDGITWTQINLPVSGRWEDIATDGVSNVVAVSGNGYNVVVYSTNGGATWSNTTSPNSGGMVSITYGNGRFVAVNRSSTVAGYSTTGATWTSSTLPYSTSVVGYAIGMFITANGNGTNNTGAYSLDGITWTPITFPISANWSSIIGVDGKAVIGGGGYGSIYATNPNTWFVKPQLYAARHVLAGSDLYSVGDTSLSRIVFLNKLSGGMVWLKSRSTATNNFLFDTARGTLNELNSNNAEAQASLTNSVTSFNANGFSLGSAAGINVNSTTYASWTFRKAPKFFDVVTYTGNGAVGGNNLQVINHSLGITPGMIVVKASSAAGTNWVVWHKNLINTYNILRLNTTDAQANYPCINAVGASSFNVYNQTTNPAAEALNNTGVSYVAYLFAHDPSEDGIIQCGSFTTDASNKATVNLGWEPQYLLFKRATGGTGNWIVVDSMRGMTADSTSFDPYIHPNLSVAEQTNSYFGYPTSTGFEVTNLEASCTHIYLAIRRPNKPPTSGSQVFAIDTRHAYAQGYAFYSGFPVDLSFFTSKTGAWGTEVYTRLTESYFYSPTTNAEVSYPNAFTFNTGFYQHPSVNSDQLSWMFKRAPGFFDVVCYTGDAVARMQPHGLGVIPELAIIKRRNNNGSWLVHPKAIGANGLLMESSAASAGYTFASRLNSSTATGLNLSGGGGDENALNQTYVAYLFASLPGIQWINSYVGDGTTGRVINCGFTTGARFVMVKATSATGSWWIFDSVRGIVSAADPALQLNSTAAEVTSADAIDPHSSGFIVNQEATCSLNASGVSYLVWAIA